MGVSLCPQPYSMPRIPVKRPTTLPKSRLEPAVTVADTLAETVCANELALSATRKPE